MDAPPKQRSFDDEKDGVRISHAAVAALGLDAPKDLLYFGTEELFTRLASSSLKLSVEGVQLLQRFVAQSLCNVHHAICATGDVPHAAPLSTLDAGVDALLDGGFPAEKLVEVVGGGGSGKSQLLMQAAASLLLSQPQNRALFVCTTERFCSQRFLALTTARFSAQAAADAASRLLVLRLTRADAVAHFLRYFAPAAIETWRIKGLFIDAAVCDLRAHETAATDRFFACRLANEIAFLLKGLAVRHSLHVLCTNQATAAFSSEEALISAAAGGKKPSRTLNYAACSVVCASDAQNASNAVRSSLRSDVPALGISWANDVNLRLLLSRSASASQTRLMTVLFGLGGVKKPPIAFCICERGVVSNAE